MSKTQKKDNTKKSRRRPKQKKKSFEEFEQTKPFQLSLFEIESKDKEYSQTVELYDFIPKYFWGKAERIEGEFLRTIKREFECRGRKYNLTLMPARIEDGEDGSKEYYPSQREELVEDALRKLMTERQSVMLDGEAGISFSLYQLQKELKENGHTYSYDELKDAIRVLNGTDIILKDKEETIEAAFSPIESYGFAGEGSETNTFVRFSPLVTNSIVMGNFRMINYDKAMSFKSVIARQLHKRMSHHYIQASITNKYEIMMMTIIRDFGLTRQKRLGDNLREIVKALDSLKKSNVLINYEIARVFSETSRRKIIDAKISIQPHPVFINDIVKANKNVKALRESLKNTI